MDLTDDGIDAAPDTIDRIKDDPTFTPGTHRIADSDSTEIIVPTVQLPLMANAVELAMRNIKLTVETLPSADNHSFGPRIISGLNDLRRLKKLTADVAQHAKGGPETTLLTKKGVRMSTPRSRRLPDVKNSDACIAPG